MSDNSRARSGGIGILGMTFIVFLTLKLTGYIAWSWWWVTAPIWGAFVLSVVSILLIATVAGLLAVAEQRKVRGVKK